MVPLPPRVAICTHNTELGRQVATGLSGHPFDISSHPTFADLEDNTSTRKPDVIGLILPKSAPEAVAKVRANYPDTPIVLVTESGREIPATQSAGTGRIDELKSATALQEICWWVANEVAKPKELSSLVEHQIRPILLELDGEGKILPDHNLRNLWVFPGPCPQGGDSLLDWIQQEDRPLFLSEIEKAASHSLRVFTLRIRHGQEQAYVAEAGLRSMREDRFLLILQPLVHGGPAAWHHLATHDPLTGLLNRWEIAKRLESLKPGDSGESCLLYLDLDRFKSINDTLGSAKADEFLVRIADLLRKKFPSPCLIARFMGDEFLVACPQTGAQELKRQAEDLQSEVGRLQVEGFAPEFQLGISGGIALIRGQAYDVALHRAEAALHQAKEGGRNRIFVHREGRLAPHAAQIMLEGLNKGEFVPWLQLIVDAQTEKPAFYEALARYRTADGNWVSPVQFLKLRETQGLISRMDRAIFIQVLNLLFAHPQIKISVNLSAESFSLAPFPGCFLRMARDGAVETERILIEISEECMKLPKELVLERVGRMREVGMEVLLDDFGGGLSPLSYLTDFPFSMVKLDGNLTLGVEESPVKQQFLRAVVDMAKAKGMKVVAEFVAGQEQKNKLATLGIDFFQGYLYGTPAPAEKVLALK